jgi:uncharacterized membrane protein YhaH (DUF805 family)
MSIIQMLFGFQGRLRRRDFWLCTLGLMVVSWVVYAVLAMAMMPAVHMSSDASTVNVAAVSAMSSVWGLCALIMLWPSLAIAIKRCHDRDQTGLWVLMLLIPVIGFFWWLINLGILDGTPGPNKFGPSPKGLGEAVPAV